jgi:hypothetical protein
MHQTTSPLPQTTKSRATLDALNRKVKGIEAPKQHSYSKHLTNKPFQPIFVFVL